MAIASLQLCDFCENPMQGFHPRVGRKQVIGKQGLVVTVGYSEGGWGNRRNHIDFSGEVCQECYSAVMKDVVRLSKTMARLKEGGEYRNAIPSFRV